MAGFFGIFFGTLFFESLVLPDAYEWPFSRANAAFIAAFYKEVAGDPNGGGIEERGSGSSVRGSGNARRDSAGGGAGPALRVFFAFFAVTFCWFAVPNYLVPALLTMPLLCFAHTPEWQPVLPFGRGGSADWLSVLSSGVAGSGMPGVGGWASSWAYGPSIVPLETTVWIVIGSMLTSWVFVPVAFFSGLAAWPTSFGQFTANGTYYNATEGHFHATREPPHLSAVGMTMYSGVALSIVSMFVECTLLLIHTLRRGPRDSSGAAGRRPRTSSGIEYLGGEEGERRPRRAEFSSALTAPATGHPTPGAQEMPPRLQEYLVASRPLGMVANVAVVAGMTILAVGVVALVLPPLGLPLWMTVFCIGYGLCSSFGCGLVYAVIGQNFSGGCCILMQILCGLLVPGSARANILSVMLVNSGISQAMAVLGDLKTALYLSVSMRAMLQAQLLGAVVGVIASASTFLLVLELSDAGKLTLGSGEWPATGAVSIALNAKVFGEEGPGALLHGALLNIVLACAAVGVVGTLALAAIPDRYTWKRYLPSPVLLGVAGLYSGINFASTSMLLIALIYQVYLRCYQPRWFGRFQYISTSGVNAGVGLGGLVVILLTSASVPSIRLGPIPTGSCDKVQLPAVTSEDVACWNAINGYSGCNTPWPSN